MEPNIIVKDTILIAGVTGNGNETGKLWEKFAELSKSKPLDNKINDNGYEIRIYSRTGECKCHVGIPVKNADVPEEYRVISLPASMYAEFEVYPSQGYTSQNDAMDKWLDANSGVFKQRHLEEELYSVLVYDHRYKDDKDAESVVGIWVPIAAELICQSCSMPMSAADLEVQGTNSDGSRNSDYCIHCFKDGEFTSDITMDEMIEECIPYTSNNNPWPDEETARSTMKEIFPKLKRWRNS